MLCRDNGKEHGSYYLVLGTSWIGSTGGVVRVMDHTA